jgi:tRNA 2-thiouridine synthesizing protein A
VRLLAEARHRQTPWHTGPVPVHDKSDRPRRKRITEEEDMAGEDLSTIQADKIVDARGTSCPGPILAAKKGIVDVKVGEIMEVQATDSGTMKDLPAWSKKMGHEYLGYVEEPGFLKLFVRKMK